MDLTLALEPTHILDVRSESPKHWVVVGAGGNGGYFIPQLARQISLQNKILKMASKKLEHKITIIDRDLVEDKNLTRQNFLPRDVGQNKAQVMADRYGRAFGLEITYVPEYLTSPEMLTDILNASGISSTVIVGAVDNNKTRAIIHSVFKSRKDTFWLDSGNEEFAGQVVCGFNSGRKSKNALSDKPTSPYFFDLPAVTELHPEVLEATDKLPDEQSCAERAVSNPQNIFTNQTAASLLMGFANTILTAKALDGNGLRSHAVAFNSQTMSFTTVLNKKRFLLPAPPQPIEEEAKAEATPEVKEKKPKKSTTVEKPKKELAETTA